METLNITIKEAIPMERIGDLLCAMYESSPEVAQWAECIGDVPPITTSQYRWQYPMNGGALLFKDIAATGEGLPTYYKLDIEAIRRGLEVMVRDYPQHWADFRNEKDGSVTADVFLQCALFGSVIYG